MDLEAKLRFRAEFLDKIRQFFKQGDVLEVSTPLLSGAASTDPNIASFSLINSDKPAYLQTSPEFAMKQLLAMGSGSIFQICPVFREGEVGRYHQPEFTMLEWYRLEYDHHKLIHEVDELIRYCVQPILADSVLIKKTYQQAFMELADIDPLHINISQCKYCCEAHNINYPETMSENDIDEWLDLIFSHLVAPKFNQDKLTVVYNYPASQAALARLCYDKKNKVNVAARFEFFWGDVELANGFHELCDADQQLARFKAENKKRSRQNKPEMPIDMRLIEAMRQGLPECAGVALGIERLLMRAMQSTSLHDINPFG